MSTSQPTTTTPPATIPLSWDDLAATVADAGDGMFIATSGADRRPHVTWVMPGWADERLWISIFADSQKAANLRNCPDVAMTCAPKLDANVLIRATARLVDDPDEVGRLWADGVLPYDPGMFFSGPEDPRAPVRRADPDGRVRQRARPRSGPSLASGLTATRQPVRQGRSNGSRQARGAISGWIALGPHEPGAYERTGGGDCSSGADTLPQALDALGAVEQRVVAAHGVVDQPLVRLEHVAVPLGLVHRELQAELVELHARARALAVERQRELRRVGEVEREVVGSQGADAGARLGTCCGAALGRRSR